MKTKLEKRNRLKSKIRAKVAGTAGKPRLSVYRSNQFIYAQVIDDQTGQTLVSASDAKLGEGLPAGRQGTKTQRAKEVGKLIAEVCKKAKIGSVVFDRNGFKYTGRIKLLADEARAQGLKF